MASGFDLLFCAHHSKEHADKLKQVALKIHDESRAHQLSYAQHLSAFSAAGPDLVGPP